MDSQQQGILISASAVPFCGEVEETTKTRQAVAFYSLFQNVSVLDFPGERIPRNRDDDDIYKLQMNNANDEGKSRMAHEQRSPCPSSWISKSRQPHRVTLKICIFCFLS